MSLLMQFNRNRLFKVWLFENFDINSVIPAPINRDPIYFSDKLIAYIAFLPVCNRVYGFEAVHWL